MLQPWAVLSVELAEPATVPLDGRVLLHQQRLGDVLLIVPDHHIPFKLEGERKKVKTKLKDSSIQAFSFILLYSQDCVLINKMAARSDLSGCELSAGGLCVRDC